MLASYFLISSSTWISTSHSILLISSLLRIVSGMGGDFIQGRLRWCSQTGVLRMVVWMREICVEEAHLFDRPFDAYGMRVIHDN